MCAQDQARCFPFSLSELASVCLCNQRACKRECFLSKDTADKLRTCGYVAPLVCTTHLESTSLVLVEIEEVIALEKLVSEFGERHTVASLTGESLLYRVLRHHVVYSDVLSDLTCEIKESEVLHPVVVVHKLCLVLCLGLEIEEFAELSLDACYIVIKRFLIE